MFSNNLPVSILAWLWFILPAAAQEMVTKNYQFQDGIYLQANSFHRNRPDYAWDEVEKSLFTNPQTFLTQVEFIRADSFSTQDVWGFCIGGIPYVRLEPRSNPKELPTFAGLQVRGNICYFSVQIDTTEMAPMSAYNPANGRPFRTGIVERDVRLLYQWMLRFETGEVAEFNRNNFLEWIQDDPGLSKSVRELSETEAGEKLFKCLLIYDDRNPVFIPD